MFEIFVKGGPVMYPLLACSVISLTVVIERFFFWIRLYIHRNQSLVDEMLRLCQNGNWEDVKAKVAGSKDYIIKILNIQVRATGAVKTAISRGALPKKARL